MYKFLLFINIILVLNHASAQQSVARQWNEMQLKAIRRDFSRPPVQARNLFHVSVAMYDAWAAYNIPSNTYLLGKTVGPYTNTFNGIPNVQAYNTDSLRQIAISYAAYRVLKSKYASSAQAASNMYTFDSLFMALGHSSSFTSTNYATGNPAALGNYIASVVLAYGLADSANQVNNYANNFYTTVNAPLYTAYSGNPLITDINRWQPLSIPMALDQNGNPINSLQTFLNPEWGRVVPFGLTNANKTINFRNGNAYPVYLDPGPPPMHSMTNANDSSSMLFKMGHAMVAIWASHHSGTDNTMIDISPASMGDMPQTSTDYYTQLSCYKYLDGGDSSQGYAFDPFTALPYNPNIVKRGDYSRVLSQYWADGPNSETPPGHWFVILNDVNDQPTLNKQWNGSGPTLNNLEWDVKSYLTLGGGMHDAAIAVWGIKGWYDAPRPINTIRALAALGQSTDNMLPNYHAGGLPLIPGYIELIGMGDPLVGAGNVNLNKIKLKSWRGFNYIPNATINSADVGWILASEWMPYQRKTFVTPPFAGYISGHAAYSRTAAEILISITGSEYFPGGLYQKTITTASNFLVFEQGPTTDITLQWAKYVDASNQSSVSRIWGGIHPFYDDMNGRSIGTQVATTAFAKATNVFGAGSTPLSINNFTAVSKNCNAILSWEQPSNTTCGIYKSMDGINYNLVQAVNNINTITVPATSSIEQYKLITYSADKTIINQAVKTVQHSNCNIVANKAISSIYPNPSNGIFYTQVPVVKNNSSLQINMYNLVGALVYTQNLKLDVGIHKLKIEPTTALPIGMYTVVFTLNNENASVQNLQVQ